MQKYNLNFRSQWKFSGRPFLQLTSIPSENQFNTRFQKVTAFHVHDCVLQNLLVHPKMEVIFLIHQTIYKFPNLKSTKNETTSINVLEKRIALVKLRCYLSWPPSPPCSCMKVAWQVLKQLIGDVVACFTRSNSVVKGPHLDGLVTRGK